MYIQNHCRTIAGFYVYRDLFGILFSPGALADVSDAGDFEVGFPGRYICQSNHGNLRKSTEITTSTPIRTS